MVTASRWISASRPEAEEDTLPVIFALSSSAVRTAQGALRFSGRVVYIASGLIRADGCLIGRPMEVDYLGPNVERVRLVSGILVHLDIPMKVVHEAIDAIGSQENIGIRMETDVIGACREPSARVPLSLLKLFRGQEGLTEAARKALVMVWAEDRQTGKRPKNRRKP